MKVAYVLRFSFIECCGTGHVAGHLSTTQLQWRAHTAKLALNSWVSMARLQKLLLCLKTGFLNFFIFQMRSGSNHVNPKWCYSAWADVGNFVLAPACEMPLSLCRTVQNCRLWGTHRLWWWRPIKSRDCCSLFTISTPKPFFYYTLFDFFSFMNCAELNEEFKADGLIYLFLLTGYLWMDCGFFCVTNYLSLSDRLYS